MIRDAQSEKGVEKIASKLTKNKKKAEINEPGRR